MNTRMERSHNLIRYNVNPRYTPGSPALVDSTIAQRVMRSEQAAYDDMIKGIYGEDKKAQALRLGLRGIVEETWEFRNILMYRDMITGETGDKPKCKECGFRHQVGKLVRGIYEPHPAELKYHPEMDRAYWEERDPDYVWPVKSQEVDRK